MNTQNISDLKVELPRYADLAANVAGLATVAFVAYRFGVAKGVKAGQAIIKGPLYDEMVKIAMQDTFMVLNQYAHLSETGRAGAQQAVSAMRNLK